MADLVTPHLAFPFRLRNGREVQVEQGSDDEVEQAAEMVLYYRQGERTALPDYGIPEYALRMSGVDPEELAGFVVDNEPRATAMVERPEVLTDYAEIANVTLEVDRG